MPSYQYFLLVVFSIILWLMIVDPNVSEYINLIFKIIGVNIQRFFWMVKYHPNNFITTFIQNRKYDKIAKELEKEFAEKKIL